MSSVASKSETSSGSVSAQAAAGETVTLTLLQPDGTTQATTAITAADKSWVQAAPLTVTQDGSYTLTAHVDSVGGFSAADATMTVIVGGITIPRTISIGSLTFT